MTRMSQLGMAGGMADAGMAGMAMMAPAPWTPDYALQVLSARHLDVKLL